MRMRATPVRDGVLWCTALAVLVCLLSLGAIECRADDTGHHTDPVVLVTAEHCHPGHHGTHAEAVRHDLLSRVDDDARTATPLADAATAPPAVPHRIGRGVAQPGPPSAGWARLLELCVART